MAQTNKKNLYLALTILYFQLFVIFYGLLVMLLTNANQRAYNLAICYLIAVFYGGALTVLYSRISRPLFEKTSFISCEKIMSSMLAIIFLIFIIINFFFKDSLATYFCHGPQPY